MSHTTITNPDVPGFEEAIIGKTEAACWIRATAHQHGVSYAESPLDRFAAAVSRLSDADVQFDQTEELLLALARAGIVSNMQSFVLHAAYLRQRRKGASY